MEKVRNKGIDVLADLYDAVYGAFWHQKVTFEEKMAWGSLGLMLAAFTAVVNLIK